MFERFFYNDDSTLVDRTIEWSNPYTATGAWDCKSYLYISSILPFNHRYFDIATANDQAGTLSVDIWYNNAWTPAVDIVDYTSDLSSSGSIYFTPNELKGWDTEDDSSDITELSTTKVYSAYWMRFGFDASADSACVINYIGYKFCDDNDLYSFYPIFNNANLRAQFKTGKTSWSEQAISASNIIISDLIKRNFMQSKNQVLDSRLFRILGVHKTAELIFSGLGGGFKDERIEARKEYDLYFNANNLGIDINKDGDFSVSEAITDYTRLSR